MNVKSVPQAAFSLVEVMVSISILAVAIFATLAALAQSARLRQGSAETEVATQLIQARLAEIRSTSQDMTDVAAQGGAFSLDDPRLKNLAGTVEVLSEADASASFRCDLDRNGVIDANDLYDLDNDGLRGEGAGDSDKGAYTRLVPVRVSVTWESIAGHTRSLFVESFVYPSGG